MKRHVLNWPCEQHRWHCFATNAIFVAALCALLTAGTLAEINEQYPINATPITLTQLAQTIHQWVEFEGEVRAANTDLGRLELTFRESGQKCTAYVMGPCNPKHNAWIGERVKIRGLNASQIENSRVVFGRIVVPGTNLVTVIEEEPQMHPNGHEARRALNAGGWQF